jgi:hypothetical protein
MPRKTLGIIVFLLFFVPIASSARTVSVSPTFPNHADDSRKGTIAWWLTKMRDTGGTIQLKAGEYLIEESLVLPDHITIEGAGQEKTFLKAGAGLQDHILNNPFSDALTGPGIHHVTIRNLTLKGKRSVRKNCVQLRAANPARSSYLLLENLTVRNCGRHGVHIKGANHVTLRHIRAFDNGENVDHDHNIYLLRVTDALVEEIHTSGAAGNGFSSTLLRDAAIRRVTAVNNGRRGLRFGGGEKVTVSDCTVRQNSQARGRHAAGIVITSDDYHHHSNTISITHCLISKNRGSGIRASFAREISVHSNMIEDNHKFGIRADATELFQYENVFTGNDLGETLIQ